MQSKTFFLLCILACANAFVVRHPAISVKNAAFDPRVAPTSTALKNEFVDTVIPLTITASAFWSTIKRSADPDAEFVFQFKPASFDLSSTVASSEESAGPSIAAKLQAVALAAAEATAGAAAAETTAAAVSIETEEATPITPATPVIPVRVEPVAVAAVADEVAVPVAKTKTSPLKSLAKVLFSPWKGLMKSFTRMFKFLYLPWLGMIPGLSKVAA